MPFGVDLDNVEFPSPPSGDASASGSSGGGAPAGEANTPRESAPETRPEAPAKETQREEPRETPRLDSPRAHKEMSREDLERLFGEPTAPRQDTARFDQNFPYDIAALVKDPSLLSKFAEIYPSAYVEKAKAILNQYGIGTEVRKEAQKPPPTQEQGQLDPRIQKALQFAEQFEQMQREQKISRINTQLDSSFETLGKKYPDANPNVVNWYLQGLAQKGINLQDENGNLKTNIVERIFKAEHEQTNKAYEAKYRAKVEEQKRRNNQSKDMGSGGSPSATPGKGFKNLKETTQAILKDLNAAG